MKRAAKTEIRVIKREQREAAQKTNNEPAPAPPTARRAGAATRELAATVSGWVRDFQQRPQVSPRYAFAGLFK